MKRYYGRPNGLVFQDNFCVYGKVKRPGTLHDVFSSETVLSLVCTDSVHHLLKWIRFGRKVIDLALPRAVWVQNVRRLQFPYFWKSGAHAVFPGGVEFSERLFKCPGCAISPCLAFCLETQLLFIFPDHNLHLLCNSECWDGVGCSFLSLGGGRTTAMWSFALQPSIQESSYFSPHRCTFLSCCLWAKGHSGLTVTFWEETHVQKNV